MEDTEVYFQTCANTYVTSLGLGPLGMAARAGEGAGVGYGEGGGGAGGGGVGGERERGDKPRAILS